MTTSWDCFDTLVARRRFDPLTVFDDMGTRLQLDNFTQRRKAAESRAPWTLDTIYDELAKDYKWTEEEKNHYKDLEIFAEVHHCCPVMETINQVEDGDLVVSDMYLPEYALRMILEKCGLRKNVTIHVSTGGKSSGSIWKTLPKIDRHVGDNYHSDVTSPKASGINGIHFTGTDFTDLERLIGGDLALLMRIVRLANPYAPRTVLWEMWNEQAQLNIPALVLAALEIPSHGVAFVMRDCVHLQRIHEALHNSVNPAFHCSRLAFSGNSKKLELHAREVALGRIVVDIHGTGNSITRYWRETFNTAPRLLYVTGTMQNGTLLVHCLHDAIEYFNSSDMGSIGNDWPERLSCEYDDEITLLQKKAIDCALSHLPCFSIAPSVEKLKTLVALMPGSVTVEKNSHVSSHDKKGKASQDCPRNEGIQGGHS